MIHQVLALLFLLYLTENMLHVKSSSRKKLELILEEIQVMVKFMQDCKHAEPGSHSATAGGAVAFSTSCKRFLKRRRKSFFFFFFAR